MVTKTAAIVFNKAEGRAIAEMVAQKLNTSTGFALKAQQGKTGDIQLKLNDTPNAQLGPEGYTLEATPIHVGGDECYKGFWVQDEGWQALMKKLNIRHVEDLQGYFMGRVEKS